jgi:hypothetical protein
MNQRPYQVCRNCVMDTTDSKITFDATGLCDHCQNFYAVIELQRQQQIADTSDIFACFGAKRTLLITHLSQKDIVQLWAKVAS